MIEAWAEESRESTVEIHVNRTPITGDVCTTLMKDRTYLGLIGCGLSNERENIATPVKVVRNRHFRFVVNVIAPYLPITTDGKEPDLTCIRDELAKVLAKAAARAKRKPSGAAGVSKKQVIIEALPAAIDKAGQGGRLRYSLRRLFYAVRPRFLEVFGEEPNYDTFSQAITAHEAELGHDLLV